MEPRHGFCFENPRLRSIFLYIDYRCFAISQRIMKKIIALFLAFATMCQTSGPAIFASEDNASSTDPIANEENDSGLGQPNLLEIAGGQTSEILPAPDPARIESASTTEIEIAPPTVNENSSSTEISAGASSAEAMGNATTTAEARADGEADATTTSETEIGDATTTMDAAATTDGAGVVQEAATSTTATSTVATSTIDTGGISTENATSEADLIFAPAAPRMAMLAVWQMAGGGFDDDPAAGAQFAPSGEYRVSRNIQMCGILANGNPDESDGVYGQMFYPVGAGFAPGDGQGRQGCGQVVGPACKMEKLSSEASFDLFCEKIQKNNTNLPLFDSGLSYVDLCAADGKLLARTASVYCCEQELAYDDAAGEYDAGVIAKGAAGDYSNTLLSKFAYLPLSKIDIGFNNVYYGTVQEGVEAVTDETITRAAVRNVGNVPAKVSLWQDDMGLGQTAGVYNIRYGARLSGIGAPWTYYKPFETISMSDALAPGQSADMEFSVKVLNFPETAGESKSDYRGQMKIDAVFAPANYQCQSPEPNEAQTISAAAPVSGLNGAEVKPETDLPEAATTTAVEH